MRLLFLLFCLSLTGCASIFFNDYKQVVKVTSEPSGVSIYDQRGQRLGTTPAYVKVRRNEIAQLRLESTSGEVRTVTLQSHYRWSPSFYGNLVFMTAAPLGMGVDYLTKTAFQLENPETVQFKPGAKGKDKVGPNVVVIAPPQSEWSSLSNQAGVFIQDLLKEKFPKKYVKNYNESRPVFIEHHYRYDYREEGEELEKIFYELDADEYVESNVEVLDVKVKIEVIVRDAFTKDVKNTFVIERPHSDFKVLKRSSFRRELSKYFAFMPNAVGVDFTSYSSSFTLADGSVQTGKLKEIQGDRVNAKGFDQWLNLIGALNVMYVRPPSRGGWTYNFLFVPSFYVSAVTFKYPLLEDIKDIEFRRFRAGLGYGPQVSMSSRYGMLYLSYVPTFNYTKISWGSQGRDQQTQMGEVLGQFEVGYQLFLSNTMAMRLFVKGWTENSDRWASVVTKARGVKTEMDSSNVSLGGLSLIWYWPGLQSEAIRMVD